MTNEQTHESGSSFRETSDNSKSTTMPASKVGVTLTISDRALKELKRIQEKTVEVAQKAQRFSWR